MLGLSLSIVCFGVSFSWAGNAARPTFSFLSLGITVYEVLRFLFFGALPLFFLFLLVVIQQRKVGLAVSGKLHDGYLFLEQFSWRGNQK